MKELKKIYIFDVPAAVSAALEEHLAQDAVFAGRAGESPDLVICDEEKRQVGEQFPGCPVLPLSFATPLQLGIVLREILQMLDEPVLYMDDVSIGPYVFSAESKTLTPEKGESIALTDREVDILAYLCRHHEKSVPREDLLKNVWKYQKGVDTHTLETHIYRLRQKMESRAEDPQILVTEDNGYHLYLERKNSC